MKLVIVTNILTPYRIPLFKAMAEAVDDFTVCLMAKQEENRQWEIGPVPFKTEVLNGFHMKMRSSKISAHWNYGVISALRRMNPDVVMSGGFTPANVEAYLYCKLFGRAYVGWGEFSLRDNARSSAIRRALRRWMTKGSAASIASSSEAHDAFLHYGAKRHTICTALMPIDVERFHREASEFRHAAVYEDRRTRFSKPIILSVGRLTDRKGFRDLLAIYGRVVAKEPGASLLLVGDGPDRPAYEEFVRHHSFSNVHFLGIISQTELPTYLALADVFVFPTLSDTYGAALAEAMAAEVPVVSSIFAAATQDLVADGVNGYRIIPTLHEASAERVLDLLHLPTVDRAAMGRAAYEVVKHTDVVPSADVMVRFLRSLCAAPVPSGAAADGISASSTGAAG